MAWVTPRNWVPTERVTASMLNQHLRDNLLALRADQLLAVIPRTDTGAVNNWAPALGSAQTFIEWNGAADVAITGLAGGSAGMQVTVKNVSTTKVMTFAFNSGSSLVAARFQNLATSAPTPTAPGGWIRYVHDGTDWKLAEHEQGTGITPAFNAAHFTGNVAAWTVDSGDVIRMSYYLRGRKLTVEIYLTTTSLAAGTSTSLMVANGQWGGFTPTANIIGGGLTANDNGAGFQAGLWQLSATAISLFRAASAAWSASTNLTGVGLSFTFEVT